MTEQNLLFNGVVLAGGLSTRMGQDKALLEINGETLLSRSKRILNSAGANQVLISRNGFADGTIPDIYPQNGPLSGIHAALFASELAILCVPVDMPFVDEAMLKHLVIVGSQTNQITTFSDHNLPIYIPCRNDIKAYLEHTLTTDNNKSIRQMLKSFGYSQVSTSDTSSLSNVNTPEQWQFATQQNT